MANQNEQHKKRRAAAAVEDLNNPTERIGLWVGLGTAALATVGVLALAFYTEYQTTKQTTTKQTVLIEETISVVPASESQAEQVAFHNGEQQAQGMIAPAETAPIHESIVMNESHLVVHPVAEHDAKVLVENGVVKFYFATAKAELPDDVMSSLKDVVKGVHAGKKAVVSGFADSTGDEEFNERLSKERAFKVRSALLAAGVPSSSIEMQKPQNITGSGAKDEARRVEVVLK